MARAKEQRAKVAASFSSEWNCLPKAAERLKAANGSRCVDGGHDLPSKTTKYMCIL
jgi:hypothetical protein